MYKGAEIKHEIFCNDQRTEGQIDVHLDGHYQVHHLPALRCYMYAVKKYTQFTLYGGITKT